MGMYSVRFRCVGLFIVVLVAGLMGGLGVAEVEAGCPEQVVLDTRECEHLWERLDLPGCIGVDAEYEFTEYSFDALCKYKIALRNYCSVAYELSFKCDGVRSCPEALVLEPGKSETVALGDDNYGKNEVNDAEVVMLFTAVKELREGNNSAADEVKLSAGVFMGGSFGEVKYDIPPGCVDDKDGCQVASMGRPVGGLVGLGVMVLGLVGIVWRRRVVG